jgi:hypothetical protein
MPSSLFYFPSMTSIHSLLNIFHSLSVKYFPFAICLLNIFHSLSLKYFPTHSKGPPVSKEIVVTQTSKNNTTLDHPKKPFSPSKGPIRIQTRELPKQDYNIVEYLKTLRANISVMDICKIPQKKDFLLQALNSVENLVTGNGREINLASTNLVNKPTVNTYLENKKGNTFVPPFLLTFKVFNRNLHNCLVYSGASSNVMALFI